MIAGVNGGSAAPDWLVDRTFSAYAPMDSGPPQAIENGGGAPPDVHGLPYSVTRHTAGHRRWLGSCLAGSLGVAAPRPYSTRIGPLLRLPSRALAARQIAPSAARRALTSSVRSLTFPARISEPGRRHGNPDYPAQPWLVVGLSGSVRGAFRGLGCSGRPGRVGYGITQVGDVALNLHTCRPTMTPRNRPRGR
ncbi:hypothetical protein TIFTF001_048193 [Ficus carica]|uniref:Uncharacterized protein n=1 Tax=Ficus carica TaxID=3494 RepID=A0AA87ZV77_FICCA|nr:hypothetical protein TIFTF001_048193 [Ficus carica]